MMPVTASDKRRQQESRVEYGKILLDYSLEKAKELGCGAVCFEGNIDFASYGMQEKRDLHYLLLNGRRIEKR